MCLLACLTILKASWTYHSWTLHSLHLTGDAWEEEISEDATQIANILAESLPAPQSNIATSNPFAAALFNPSLVNSSTLISLRRAYQTKQAETGVGGSQKSIPNSSEDSTSPTRQEDLREFHAIIKAHKRKEVWVLI